MQTSGSGTLVPPLFTTVHVPTHLHFPQNMPHFPQLYMYLHTFTSPRTCPTFHSTCTYTPSEHAPLSTTLHVPTHLHFPQNMPHFPQLYMYIHTFRTCPTFHNSTCTQLHFLQSIRRHRVEKTMHCIYMCTQKRINYILVSGPYCHDIVVSGLP